MLQGCIEARCFLSFHFVLTEPFEYSIIAGVIRYDIEARLAAQGGTQVKTH